MTGTGPAARPAAVSAPRPDGRRHLWLRTVPDGAGTLPPAGQPGRGRTAAIASRELHRHVEISDAERTVAAAEVTCQGPGGTARVSLRAVSGHITPGRRASLVDAVLDLPEVRESTRLKVAFPLGDCETLQRLQERCPDVRTHPAGGSAIVEANLPAGGHAAHRADHRGNGPPRTSLDVEANGRKTKPDQALSGSAGHFAAQCLRVLSGDNEYAAPDPGSAGITAWR